ncbi:MAG: 4Fe-4S dicluster domain-containing protein [Thermoplasmata archaeon]
MDSMALLVIVTLTSVGLGCGIAIYLANRFLPEEDETLKAAEDINQYLPGMDCGACGHPGCFAYAREVAQDKSTLQETPCMSLMNDDEALCNLGQTLGVDLSGGVRKVAVIHCTGESEVIFEYQGVNTCKSAMQVSAGFKKCPYGCLGLGDCAEVCPVEAISIDQEKKIAVVDPEKCIGCGLCVKECPNGLIELIPAEMPQYLGCNYLSKKDIPGREKCSVGCIHCRLCVKAAKDDEVQWNDEKDLPYFDPEKCLPAPDSIEKCPRDIIIPRG